MTQETVRNVATFSNANGREKRYVVETESGRHTVKPEVFIQALNAMNEQYRYHHWMSIDTWHYVGEPPILFDVATKTLVPSKRLVAIGNETGATAVAADFDEQLEAERRELADYDTTVNDAANRRGY
jgi:hypothetical protein